MAVKSIPVGSFITSSTTIANGQSSSAAIPLQGCALVGITLPAAFTGTALTFEVSDSEAGTYAPLYDAANALISMTVAQGRSYALDPAKFYGFAFIKIKSGSAEGGLRTINYSMRG